MAVDLYSYAACLGTLVIDWVNRKFVFAGMEGDAGVTEMTADQVQTILAENANNPDIKALGLIFWPENEQLAVHDVASFAAELEHVREINGEDAVEEATDDVPDDAVIRQLAVNQYASGEINIDDDAVVSVGNDGAYVSAWVFVNKDEIPGWDREEADNDAT